MDDHSKLLEAIRSKDAATARQEMENHIMHSGELLAAHFHERMAASEKSDADLHPAQEPAPVYAGSQQP